MCDVNDVPSVLSLCKESEVVLVNEFSRGQASYQGVPSGALKESGMLSGFSRGADDARPGRELLMNTLRPPDGG